jgi:D-glycerate 3-kinase
MKSKQFETKASVIFSHIDAHLTAHRPAGTPLFVALQAPQGAGKTSLTARVRDILTEHNEDRGPYRVATLSIDDLFLPRAQMRALAAAHPDNPLLCGRGFPGTYDMSLAISLLHSLKEINRPGSGEVHIPHFDKSLFNGEGDRVPESEWNTVKGPLDVVLLEGWLVGFYPQSRQYIEERMNQVPIGLDGILDFSVYTLEHVLDANERLSEHIKWWDLFDICVQVCDFFLYLHSESLLISM